ncbi:MAG: hypothetical protein ACOYOT_07125 [Bacteroidales bacterium]
MEINKLKLEPNCEYKGKGKMELFAGASITFDVTLKTNPYGKITEYKDSSPGEPIPELVDIISLLNITTGNVVL